MFCVSTFKIGEQFVQFNIIIIEVARPSGAHGHGTVKGPKPMLVFGFILVGGPWIFRAP